MERLRGWGLVLSAVGLGAVLLALSHSATQPLSLLSSSAAQPPSLSATQKAKNLAKIEAWESSELARSWDEGDRDISKGAHEDHTPEQVTFAKAEAKALKMQARDKTKALKAKADSEEEQAKDLIGFAKSLAQKVVKREALDEMKDWMAKQQKAEVKKHQLRAHKAQALSHSATQHHTPLAKAVRPSVPKALSPSATHHSATHHTATQPLAAGRLAPASLSHSAPRAARPRRSHRPLSMSEEIKSQYQHWQTTQLRDYAKAQALYTATDFCNSRANTGAPRVDELKAAFGSDWRRVAARHPQVASLAAVSSCMQALGLSKDHPNMETGAEEWKEGALKGKADSVKECAKGNDKACAAIAHDMKAMKALKKMIPKDLQK